MRPVTAGSPARFVVVPDRGGQGENALHDPDRDPDSGAATVAFQVQQHQALVGLGTDQRKADRQTAQGAHQMQPQPPKVAGVAGAVPLACPPCQLGTVGGLA
jgi:hypothetical protein